jgi:exodeoxyribonuclease VII small subunit
MSKKKERFEDLLKRLQQISDLLESEEIGLEESIQLYEEGVNLSKTCRRKLEEAELKITNLKKELEKEN